VLARAVVILVPISRQAVMTRFLDDIYAISQALSVLSSTHFLSNEAPYSPTKVENMALPKGDLKAYAKGNLCPNFQFSE